MPPDSLAGSLALSLSVIAMAAALAGCSASVPSSSAPSGGATTAGAAPATGTRPPAGNPGSSADLDVCALLPAATAASISGMDIVGSTASTIAPGQDQCAYHRSNFALDVDVIVYQPGSGVGWTMLTQVQQDAGSTRAVSGIGDQALLGSIELDVQAGTRFIAVEGAGGTLQGDPAPAEAIAKAIIAKL